MKRIANFTRIFVAMLREVFDEAPYARFLQRSQMTSSPQAYAAFCHERENAASRRVKCC